MNIKLNTLVASMLLVLLMSTIAESNAKVVIAHRGASGYLPEHTLPTKAMVYA